MVEKAQIGLLDRAEIEEKNYKWEEAAKLYEKAAETLKKEKNLENAAKIYNKLGDICLRAILTSKTKEDYIYWDTQAVEAFNKAEDLFMRSKHKLLSTECKAKAFNAKGLAITSVEEARKSIKRAFEIFLELNENYSKKGDNKNSLRVSSLAIESITFFMFLSSDPSELVFHSQLVRNLFDKSWILLKDYDTLEIRSRLLYGEFVIININRWTELTYGDKEQEEFIKLHIKRLEETLKLAENCGDTVFLGSLYGFAGFEYCIYGGLFVEEKPKQVKFAEKGFDLMERAIQISRKVRDNRWIISQIYALDYQAGLFSRYEYLQKRILKDVREVQKFDNIFDNLYTGIFFFLDFISLSYYNDFAGRSFLKPDVRKSYAKIGIEYANKALNRLAFGPYIVFVYQYLTYFYSQLIILAIEDDPQEEYIQKMMDYADKTADLSNEYKGGNVRAAGYISLYRAYKTIADTTKNKEEKIRNLMLAIEAAKNCIKYSIESYRHFLAIQIHLALLYEELGILITEEKPLKEAKDIFFRIIKETSEKGYLYYTAACYEYIARLEDRLGNHMISAEYYKKAQNAHQDSLSSIEYKPLKDRVNTKIKYANAWSVIENAKANHKREKHLIAKKEYEKACYILRELPKYNHEASYFYSWAILENAEQYSKLENFQEAIKCYQKAKDNFRIAKMAIRYKRKMEKASKELKKLEKVANIRMDYCSARTNLERARMLAKEGEHLNAAERFALAATQISNICSLFKIKRERGDLEAVYYLCKAWENMEIAEIYEDPNKYAMSAELFLIASELFRERKLKLLAIGNSNFCLALEQGCNFDKSHDIEKKKHLFLKVKSMLRNAAFSYEKGFFKSGADWALATSTYFDGAWHLIQADEELEINKRKNLLNIGLNYLKSAAELFGESGYKNKEREVLERLNRVVKEEKILVSALNTIIKPSVSSSIEGIITPSCPMETSQSPRIGEIQQYSEEVSKFLEIDSKTKKFEIEYKDLLIDHSKSARNQCRVGIAQIGISNSGDIMNEFYEEKPKGLLTLKEEKVKHIETKAKEMIERAHQASVDILLFPEMTIDLKYRQFLEDISNLAKIYGMYIIPGSYHNIETKSNVCLVIGPEGILWQQKKHIPAIISLEKGRFKEGIKTAILPYKTIVCNTEYGRIAIIICRDFLDMDLRVELKNFEPPVDIILNPAFTPVTADFKAVHFDARRSIYAYTFFANVADYGNSLIYTPEKERVERSISPKEEGLIYKDVDLFRLRSERKKWEQKQKKEKGFIQSTR